MNLFILSFKTARKPISLLSRTTLPVLWMSPAEHISFMYQHVVMQIVQYVQSNLLHIKTWRFIFRCTFGSAVDWNIFVYNKYIQCFSFLWTNKLIFNCWLSYLLLMPRLFRPYMCPLHIEDTSFNCSQWAKSFESRGTMKRHVLTHAEREIFHFFLV